MNYKELVLDALRSIGAQKARELQANAPNMTGTEMYSMEEYIPDFDPDRQYLNSEAGYVCRSAAGRIVKLLQPYDSAIHPNQPEELPAQWSFYWSTDPEKALPFISLATSPYNTGDCCIESGKVYRSKMDGNVHAPFDYPDAWDLIEGNS